MWAVVQDSGLVRGRRAASGETSAESTSSIRGISSVPIRIDMEVELMQKLFMVSSEPSLAMGHVSIGISK